MFNHNLLFYVYILVHGAPILQPATEYFAQAVTCQCSPAPNAVDRFH